MAKNKVAEETATDETTGGLGLTRQLHDSTETAIMQEASALLNALGLIETQIEGLIEVRCFSLAGEVEQFWYTGIDELQTDNARLQRLNDAGYGIYFGVATRNKRKGSKQDLKTLYTVHADLDAKDFDAANWRAGKQMALYMLDNLPPSLEPHLLVDSGHGIHCYWPLVQPLPATPENIAAVEAVNAGLAEFLGGDPAVKDASRVLRLPGFRNTKYTDENLPVTLLGDAIPYNWLLSDFAPIMPAPKEQEQAKIHANGTDPRPGDEYNVRGDWAELLTGHGWTEVSRQGVVSHWRRPGKDDGISARLNFKGDGLLRVYSSNAQPLEVRSYDLFGAYAAFEHHGSHSDAAKALATLGYGTPKTHVNGAGETTATANEVSTPKTTHGANGRRFVAKHKGQALFNTTFKDWMIYDGARWIRDEKRAAQTMAKGVVFDLYAELPGIADDDVRKAMAQWARRCDSPTGTDAMLSEAANPLNVSDEGLDTDMRYFNVTNGTLDLTTGNLLPHDPGHMISKLSPVVYDPSATCPTYDRAILDIFSGDDDTVRFFEEAVGATLSGRASKNLIFMHGDAGDNGKSTVANLLLKLFGDYGIKGDLSLLVQPDRTDPYRASPTVVSLKGRRFCVVQEVPQGKKMDEQLVKELAGGDMLSARRLHENPIQFWPSHLIWVYGNFRLKIEDQVVFNRLHEIPFKAEFAEGDPRRDDDMPIKLEAELSGILNRFLAGYRRFVANGYRLRPSHRVKVATTSYKAESNSAMRFINERFAIMLDEAGKPNPVYLVPATSLFHEHKAFCTAKDLPPVPNKNAFGRTLTKMGIPLDGARVANRIGLRRLSEAEIADREDGADDEDASNEAQGPRF